MAARRIGKSAVDWAAFKDKIPANQTEFFRAFKARSENFVNKVHLYPAELPKIDFAFYKARLPNPALADQFQKSYESLNVPYPTDKDNVLKTIDADQKTAAELSKAYVAEKQEELKVSKSVLEQLDTLPKPDEMTEEMYCYYFPDNAVDPVNRPTFWPHEPEFQPGHKLYSKIH